MVQKSPGAMGTLLPQNSTVSFKWILGIQWYTDACLFGSVDIRSWWQLSALDAFIHWSISFGFGHESTLYTHLGKTALLHDFHEVKINYTKQIKKRFILNKLFPCKFKKKLNRITCHIIWINWMLIFI